MLCAEVMAWKSPVKCKLIFSMGSTCAYPPPAAPPFMPKHGPSEGSRRAQKALRPMRFSPKASPIDTVVLPMPALVGVMAVTNIKLLCFTFSSSINSSETFAIYLP